MLDSASHSESHPVSQSLLTKACIWGAVAWTILLSMAGCVPAPPPPSAPPPPQPVWNEGPGPGGGPVFHGGALVTDGLAAPPHTPGTLCFTVAGWCTLGAAKPIPARCDCRPVTGAPNPTGSVS
jgi:hypothetical protein